MAEIEKEQQAGAIFKATLKALTNFAYRQVGSTYIDSLTYFSYIYTGLAVPHTGKLDGWRSDYTQLLANSLQDWNRIRQCQDSTGQFFLNSMCMSLEEVNEYWKSKYKNLWLDTADINQEWKLLRVGLPSNIEIDEDNRNQLLYNSSFSIEALSRYSIPDGWTDHFSHSTGNISYSNNDSLVCGKSIKFTVPTGQVAQLSQTVPVLIPKNKSITFSCHYKNYELPSYNLIATDTPKLKISLLYNDSKVETSYVSLTKATSGEWLRSHITVTGQQDIGAITVSIEVDNRSTGNIREYYFDAPKLEINNAPTVWCSSISDVPSWLRVNDQFINPSFNVELWSAPTTRTGNIANYVATGNIIEKIPFYYLSEPERILETNELIPTRLRYQYTNETIAGDSNDVYGIFANATDPRPTEKGWLITGNTIRTYQWPFTQDTGKSYVIAEPNVLNNNILSTNDRGRLYHRYTIPTESSFMTGLGYDITYDAMTIKYNKIWLFCREEWDGTTGVVLKLLNPKTEYDSNYLELIRDYKLTNFSGHVTSIGFIDEDPPKIGVSITGNQHFNGALIDLYYDYYVLDQSTRQIYFKDSIPYLDKHMVITQ